MYGSGDINKTNGNFLRQTTSISASMYLGSNGGFIAGKFHTKRFCEIRLKAVATFSVNFHSKQKSYEIHIQTGH
jgi:hypothetical protein